MTFTFNKMKSLKKRSNDAVKIFKNSVKGLEEANKAIRFEKAVQLEKKTKLEDSLNELGIIEKRNSNFMDKINKLFED